MIQKTQHLFWRAGFGEKPDVVQNANKISIKKLVQNMLRDAEHFEPISVVDTLEVYAEFKNLRKMRKEDGQMLNRDEASERIKKLGQVVKQEEGELNTTWIEKMVNDKGVLREKMALFWHGHFACRTRNPVFAQNYLNTIRQNALGKFGDLLMAISKEPAMLQFLNNQQNKKRSPNENFAREVMELFTLGRGNYSENDIKEGARAFTGWGFNLGGKFYFNERQHDDDEKVFFGKKGNFKGEDIISMILENKKTAHFVVAKIYKFFVNEQINENRVADLAKYFYKNDYNIADLMEKIFTSDWFYDEANIGKHIKSPVELLAGIQRTMGVNFEEKQPLLFVQRVLGQVLLYPPNVAGWAGGKNWIDSSSLLFRMQLPFLIFKMGDINIAAKSDGDVNTDFQTRKGKKNNFQATVDWQSFTANFKEENRSDLLKKLSQYFLQVPVNQQVMAGFLAKTQNENQEEAIKKMALGLMMMPEYQLC
jgi:uncharacterized protein (DUF1800 family)